MKPHYLEIHSNFKLNGISYSLDELKVVAYSLIKEGEPFEQKIGDFLLYWLDNNLTMQVHTSGSTGKPKPIVLRKSHMVNSALATGEFFGWQPGDSALLCLPATYIAGKMMLVRAMVLGLELDCVAPSSHPIDGISKCYDFCAMVPLQLENSLDALGQIKSLIVGGAPVSHEIQTRIQTQIQIQTQAQAQIQKRNMGRKPQATSLSTAIFETYGMTETITHIALKQLNVRLSGAAVEGHGTFETQTYKPYFKTLPNVTLSIDERDCLVVHAPEISDAPVFTNDLVKLISETEFEWLGRFDNVINSGGVKLFPEQIEVKLASVIPSRFFVAGLPDEKLGQKLVLVVEGTVDAEKLLQKIRLLTILEKFEIPKEIYPIVKFQQAESGKIQREATLALAKM